MKRLYQVSQSVLAAAALAFFASCSEQPAGPAKSTAEAPVQGELIAPAAPTNAAPKAEAAAVPPPLPVPPAAPAAPAPAATLAKMGDTIAAQDAKDAEYAVVGFDKLSGFEYEMPDETNVSTNKPATVGEPTKAKIPSDIKALDKKKVALKGFMLPLKVEGGLITELLVMRDQSMCCFGTVPKINEWVSVKMIGKGVKPIMDQAVTIYGSLKVGEIYESGYLVGIYAMDGDRMAGPLDL
jgi:hypothetical protein